MHATRCLDDAISQTSASDESRRGLTLVPSRRPHRRLPILRSMNRRPARWRSCTSMPSDTWDTISAPVYHGTLLRRARRRVVPDDASMRRTAVRCPPAKGDDARFGSDEPMRLRPSSRDRRGVEATRTRGRHPLYGPSTSTSWIRRTRGAGTPRSADDSRALMILRASPACASSGYVVRFTATTTPSHLIAAHRAFELVSSSRGAASIHADVIRTSTRYRGRGKRAGWRDVRHGR